MLVLNIDELRVVVLGRLSGLALVFFARYDGHSTGLAHARGLSLVGVLLLPVS